MYAIVVNVNGDQLQQVNRGKPWHEILGEIQRVLARQGSSWQFGMFCGSAQVNAVTCVLAVQGLSQSLTWFAKTVRDIRMLRLEEQTDLMPAVEQAAPGRA